MITLDMNSLDWNKVDNLIPAVVQDSVTLQVLMLGYMDQTALQSTVNKKKVTFYSRSKQKQWTKGESSGHYLELVSITPDCDNDTLLVKVKPQGPTCHLNNTSCFAKDDAPGLGMLARLEQVIWQRYQTRPKKSYTASLFAKGTQRIAQKVGEEGVEVALAALVADDEDFIGEVVDLLYHLLVLLCQRRITLEQVLTLMRSRYNAGIDIMRVDD